MVGVLLPCNVVVIDEGDHRVVATMNASMMGEVLDNSVVKEVAGEVDNKLTTVLEQLEAF
jgi:uncharacterized protein (DUF302 family)